MDNLLRPDWSSLDAGDLTVVFGGVYGGSQLGSEDTVHYPNADGARIIVHYEDALITEITPGPAFDGAEWEAVSQRIESELLESTPALARQIAFCNYRVKGWWRSEKLGLQLLPAPPQAPDPQVAVADHPFVLEHPVMKSANWLITNNRRMRDYRRLTALLNLLLEGSVTSFLPSLPHHWVLVNEGKETVWVNEGYMCPDFVFDVDALSEPTGEPMAIVPAHDYYSPYGFESWRGLQVPETLERSLEAYHGLPSVKRERFNRACYWWDMKDRFWSISQSASYGALVTAVEAMIDDPAGHGSCPTCDRSLAPGPTKLFRDFLETYAPGGVMAQARRGMYGVRSAISHGSRLMGNDLDVEWGLNPAKIRERDLHGDLWRLVRLALIKWLHRAADESANLIEISLRPQGRMFTKTVSIESDAEADES